MDTISVIKIERNWFIDLFTVQYMYFDTKDYLIDQIILDDDQVGVVRFGKEFESVDYPDIHICLLTVSKRHEDDILRVFRKLDWKLINQLGHKYTEIRDKVINTFKEASQC